MVLFFLTEIALKTTWLALEGTYNVGYYMMYGVQETKEDKILKQIEELKKQNDEEKKELEELKKSIDKNDKEEMYKKFYQQLYKNRRPYLEDDEEFNSNN